MKRGQVEDAARVLEVGREAQGTYCAVERVFALADEDGKPARPPLGDKVGEHVPVPVRIAAADRAAGDEDAREREACDGDDQQADPFHLRRMPRSASDAPHVGPGGRRRRPR